MIDWTTDPDMRRRAQVGLNLLAAIIIYWNALKLGEAVFTRKNAGLDIPAEFLAHEPLAKLLGSRLGSVLRFSGVNTHCSGF